MNAYCDRQSVDLNSIAFLFDGRRLRAEQTPEEVLSSFHMCSQINTQKAFSHFFSLRCLCNQQLEMEDGDEIDAMLHQTGGGGTII